LFSCLWVGLLEAVWIFPAAGKMGLAGLGLLRIIQSILIMITAYRVDGNFRFMGLSLDRIKTGFQKGLLWSSVFGVITGIGFFVLHQNHIDPVRIFHVNLPREPFHALLFFMVGGLIAPVAEELFFRGILYGFFRQWGLLFAIFSSTMIFVLAHPDASYVQITGGIIFAISYEKEKNLIVPITIHSLGNLSLFSLSLFT
jgi:hypothetical protein